jgi:hypothetical protein
MTADKIIELTKQDKFEEVYLYLKTLTSDGPIECESKYHTLMKEVIKKDRFIQHEIGEYIRGKLCEKDGVEFIPHEFNK